MFKKIIIVIFAVTLIVIASVLVLNNTKTYTVSFITNSESVIESQTIKKGGKVSFPIIPTKDGFVFIEWMYGESTFDFNTEVTHDFSLVAKYEKLENDSIVVSFNSDGGSFVNAQVVKINETATKPIDPTKDGHTFDGWYLDDKKFDFNTKLNNNVELVAKWTLVPEEERINEYLIIFDSYGGSKVESQKIKEGMTAVIPEPPTKKDYVFDGWTLNKKNFDFSTKITKNITLVAKWSKASGYTYTWDKEEDAIGQSYLYIVDENGNNQEGYVTINYVGSSYSETVKVTKDGILLIKDIVSISNVKK